MNEKQKARDHVFDGIFEYDNDLPRWWVNLFILTIFFAASYMFWYHSPFGGGISQDQEYKNSEIALNEKVKENNANKPEFNYASAIADPNFKNEAKDVFQTTCSPCHGEQAQGLVGPNLTDDFWIHGDELSDVERTIAKGELDKGMPAWEEILGIQKIRQLVVLIHSLQHTNPPNPKPAQGEPGVLK